MSKFNRYDTDTLYAIYGLENLIKEAFNIDENDSFEVIHIEMMENEIYDYNQFIQYMEENGLYEETLYFTYKDVLNNEFEVTPPMKELVRGIFQNSYDIYTGKDVDEYIYAGKGYDFVKSALNTFVDRKTAEFIEEFLEAFDYDILAESLFYKYEAEGENLYMINTLSGETIYYNKC